MSEKKQKAEKLTGNEQVIAYLQQLDHPLKREIEEVRELILASNSQITEHIKWNAPSFCIHNEDRITFNLYGANKFRLIFHCGAKKNVSQENKGKIIVDDTGLLQWVTDDRATVIFSLSDELTEEYKNKLKTVIAKWIEATSNTPI